MELYQGITNAFVGVFELSDDWKEILEMDDLLDFEGKTIDNDKPDWKWAAKKLRVPTEAIAMQRVKKTLRLKKQKEKQLNKIDFDAPESNSDDGKSDRSVSDNENSVTTDYASFSAFIINEDAEYQEDEMLPCQIELPQSLKDAFSSVAAGVSIDELEEFLHHVLSHSHFWATSNVAASDALFDANGVQHAIRACFDDFNLGKNLHKKFMERFLSPLDEWYTNNRTATLSTLYPDMLVENDGDDGNESETEAMDEFYNSNSIVPLSYENNEQPSPVGSLGDGDYGWLVDYHSSDLVANPFDNENGDIEAENENYFEEEKQPEKKKKRKTTAIDAIKSKAKSPLALQQSQLQQSFGDVSKVNRPGVSSSSAKSSLRVDETASHEQVEKKLDFFFRHPHSPTGPDVQVQVTSTVPVPSTVVGKPDEWFVKFPYCPDVHFYLLRGELYFIPFGFVRFPLFLLR